MQFFSNWEVSNQLILIVSGLKKYHILLDIPVLESSFFYIKYFQVHNALLNFESFKKVIVILLVIMEITLYNFKKSKENKKL